MSYFKTMSSATEIHVGTPPDDYPLRESVTVHFHDFESFTTVRGDKVCSPTFKCAGYDWSLMLYPGGDHNASDGMVSVYLQNRSSVKILAHFAILVIMSCGGSYTTRNSNNHFYDDATNTWGWTDFLNRNVILGGSNNILNKGALALTVRIKPNKDCYYPVKVNQQSGLSENIFKLFGDSTIADVAFEVNNSIFYGHKQVIKAQAPELFQLTDQFDIETPMPINDVESEIFEIMLKHVYGKDISCLVWKEHSKQILEASGKYGFSSLKIEAEAWHSKHMNLTADTAVDKLLYADGTYCLGLKQAVIEYIVENGQAVISSPSFSKLAESTELMTEVMMEFAKFNESKK